MEPAREAENGRDLAGLSTVANGSSQRVCCLDLSKVEAEDAAVSEFRPENPRRALPTDPKSPQTAPRASSVLERLTHWPLVVFSG